MVLAIFYTSRYYDHRYLQLLIKTTSKRIASHATITIIAMARCLRAPVPLDITRITKMSKEIFVNATASPYKHSSNMDILSPNSASSGVTSQI